MARDGPTPLAQELAERELDQQRWADDGGRAPDLRSDTQPTTPRVGPAVRLVYRRAPGWLPHALPLTSADRLPPPL
jgi:hypothetical protein